MRLSHRSRIVALAGLTPRRAPQRSLRHYGPVTVHSSRLAPSSSLVQSSSKQLWMLRNFGKIVNFYKKPAVFIDFRDFADFPLHPKITQKRLPSILWSDRRVISTIHHSFFTLSISFPHLFRLSRYFSVTSSKPIPPTHSLDPPDR